MITETKARSVAKKIYDNDNPTRNFLDQIIRSYTCEMRFSSAKFLKDYTDKNGKAPFIKRKYRKFEE